MVQVFCKSFFAKHLVSATQGFKPNCDFAFKHLYEDFKMWFRH